MWGLQLVVTITEAHQHQAVACWLAGSWPQSHTKLSPFDKTTAVNIQLFSSAQQANFGSVQCHHTVQYRWDHVLKGSGHITLEDARSGIEDQNWFLRSSDNPDDEGMITILPKKSGHLQNRGVTNHAGSREVLTLCSGQFVVPGAHDIDWVLGTPNFV